MKDVGGCQGKFSDYTINSLENMIDDGKVVLILAKLSNSPEAVEVVAGLLVELELELLTRKR